MEYRYIPPVQVFRDMVQAATGGIRNAHDREHRYPFLSKVGCLEPVHPQPRRHDGREMLPFLRPDAPDLAGRAGARDGQCRAGGEPLGRSLWRRDARYLDNGYVIVDFAKGARAMLELCMFAEGSRYQEGGIFFQRPVGPTGKIEALVLAPTRFWNEAIGPARRPR